MADETRVTDTEGVVTDITYEEGPAGSSVAREADAPAFFGTDDEAQRLQAEIDSALVRPADARTKGQTYVVNNGGDPRTWRTVELDDDGNATGARIGRIVVRDDGALALEYLEQQAAAELNAAEIALLERRLAEAKGKL